MIFFFSCMKKEGVFLSPRKVSISEVSSTKVEAYKKEITDGFFALAKSVAMGLKNPEIFKILMGMILNSPYGYKIYAKDFFDHLLKNGSRVSNILSRISGYEENYLLNFLNSYPDISIFLPELYVARIDTQNLYSLPPYVTYPTPFVDDKELKSTIAFTYQGDIVEIDPWNLPENPVLVISPEPPQRNKIIEVNTMGEAYILATMGKGRLRKIRINQICEPFGDAMEIYIVTVRYWNNSPGGSYRVDLYNVDYPYRWYYFDCPGKLLHNSAIGGGSPTWYKTWVKEDDWWWDPDDQILVFSWSGPISSTCIWGSLHGTSTTAYLYTYCKP